MAVGNLAPPPLRSRLVDLQGLMTREFNSWLRGLVVAINATATQATAPIVLGSLAGSLGASLMLPAAPAGVYRLSFVVRVQQAATVSSSIQVALQWISGNILQTYTLPPLTSNTTTSMQSGTTLAIVDGGSLIVYSTNYASVGGTPMVYELAVTAEAMS